jgi:hypothetical protein
MAKSKKGETGKSLSRRELILTASKGAFVLGALKFGVPSAMGAELQSDPQYLVLRRKKNRAMVYKALVDPAFRKQLETNPAAALGKTAQQFTAKNRLEVQKVMQVLKQIDDQLAKIADELLCANGGPCGIARGVETPVPLKK